MQRKEAIDRDPNLERIDWPPEAVKPRLTIEPLANLRDQVSQWLETKGWPKVALGVRIVIGVIAAAIESFVTPIPALLPMWEAAHHESDRAFARQSIPAFLWATVFGIAAGLALTQVFPGVDSRLVVGATVYLFHFFPHAAFTTKQELPTIPLFERAA